MTYRIALLPGDGIGPEIVNETRKVLDALGSKYGIGFEYKEADAGAIAIDRHGDPMPQSTLDICEASDAILFGAIGDPKYDNDPNAKVRPEQGLLKLRKEMGLYANIRPVKAYSSTLDLSPLKNERIQNADFVIYRELTSGIYFGEKGREDGGNTAYDRMLYKREEIERIASMAIEAARNRSKKLHLIDKANVLESSRLWREVLQGLEKQNTDIEFNYMFVDNAAMQIILNPAQFDVLLTGNMFGDIISDEGSVLTGSIGLLPSASIGEKTSMYEPVHGSYPQAAGKNIANPTAMMLCAAMMLDEFKHYEAAQSIRKAIDHALDSGQGTEDIAKTSPLSCSEFGDLISMDILA